MLKSGGLVAPEAVVMFYVSRRTLQPQSKSRLPWGSTAWQDSRLLRERDIDRNYLGAPIEFGRLMLKSVPARRCPDRRRRLVSGEGGGNEVIHPVYLRRMGGAYPKEDDQWQSVT